MEGKLKNWKVISFCKFLREMRNNFCYFGTNENNVGSWVEVIHFKRLIKRSAVFLKEISLLYEEQLNYLQINDKKPRFRGSL